jgi:hypothetical protein
MKTLSSFLALSLALAACCVAAPDEGTPKIKFNQTLYDFGQTSQVATVSGVFIFTNVGTGTLKLPPPRPSCGCTVAALKPDTVAPGGTGELSFTVNLRLMKGLLEKHITVLSNDPQTPEVPLTIRVDYQPLYELTPLTLAPALEFGVNDIVQSVTLTRTDGKPLQISRLEASRPWITAAVEPGAASDGSTARIRVAIRRDGPPRRFNEYVQVYTADETNAPTSSIYVYGQMMGEVAVTPEALYWNVNAPTKTAGAPAGSVASQRLTIRANGGKAIGLKNPQSTIKGLKVELVPQEKNQGYELIAKLDDTPSASVAGTVSFETSVAAQPRVEIPVIVNVTPQ